MKIVLVYYDTATNCIHIVRKDLSMMTRMLLFAYIMALNPPWA